jgi:hypothetical protein
MELLELEAAMARLHQARKPPMPVSKLVVEDTEMVAISPEGTTARMRVETLLAKVALGQLSTGDLILPDGVKTVISEGALTLIVSEYPPRLHQFDWIANDSPAGYGRGTTYRKVRLALPYVIIVAVFGRNEAGLPQLLPKNECFFRNAPLKRLDDELFYPALLNCSKFTPQVGQPLSWICTQHLQATPSMRSADPADRFRGGLDALRHCLLETAFNLSSDHHEGASWFSLSRGIDPRLNSVEAWQAASAESPLFVLEIPWLRTNHTVRQLMDRIFANLQAHRTRITNAAGLARVIFNHH